MRYVIAVILLVLGAMMLLRPEQVWKWAEAWKYRGTNGPTPWYLKMIRIGGAVLVLGAICAFFFE